MPHTYTSRQLYEDPTRVPTIEERWREGLAPLLIDKFVSYIYICPLALALLDRLPPDNTRDTLSKIVLMLFTVFAINVGVYRYGGLFHKTTDIRESPLFRAAHGCLCIAAIARHTGRGVVCFTVVTFLPLIYVYVSERLPSVTALYAGIFLGLTGVVHFVPVATDVTTDMAVDATQSYSTTMYWLLLIYGTTYHALWSSSHRHTSDTDDKPLLSHFFLVCRNSALPIAITRTLIALLCILGRGTYSGSTPTHRISYHNALHFTRVLSLLVTTSTFLSWAHCQHSHRNTLSSVLAASVLMSACGLLVDNVEQAVCLCLVAPIAIWVDVSRIRKRDGVSGKTD